MNLNHIGLYTALLLSLALYACGDDREAPAPSPGLPAQRPGDDTGGSQKPTSNVRMDITAGGVVFEALLGDSPAAAAFAERLPMRVVMRELNGDEKYCYLSSELPASAVAVGRVRSGELMLFGTDCLVLFYESFPTSYRYTPIGRIENPEGLAAALGRGDVTIKFEIRKDEGEDYL